MVGIDLIMIEIDLLLVEIDCSQSLRVMYLFVVVVSRGCFIPFQFCFFV